MPGQITPLHAGNLVAGKARGVAHIMRGIVQRSGLNVARQRDQRNSECCSKNRGNKAADAERLGSNCCHLHLLAVTPDGLFSFLAPGRSPGSRVDACARLVYARFVQTLESNSQAQLLLDNIQSLSSSAYRGFDPEREAVLQVAAAAPTICGALFCFVFVSLVRLRGIVSSSILDRCCCTE